MDLCWGATGLGWVYYFIGFIFGELYNIVFNGLDETDIGFVNKWT
jgi:hypothetical protein